MNENNQNIEIPAKTTSEPQQFAHNVIWVGIANVFTLLLGIITLPALTKSYTTEMYGIWAQVSVTVSLIAPLLTLSFGTAVVRFLAGEEDKAKRRRYLGSMLSAIVILSCLVLAASFLLSKQLSVLLFDSPDYSTFVLLTFIWIFVSALFSFLLSYLRARKKIGRLSIIQGALSALHMIVIVAVASAGLSLEWIIACMIVIVVLFICGLLVNIIKEIGCPYPNFAGLKGFLAFSLPQVPSVALLWIISASDRYFITHFLGLAQTGVYSSSRVLGGLIALFFAPISFVLFPTVSRAWEQKRMSDVKIYFEYSTKLFLTLAIPAAAGITLLSQPLLKVLATSEYLAGWELVLLVAIGAVFLGIYQINLYIIYLVKQTKWLPVMIILASVTSISINLILIPRMGITGAAISNIAAYFVLAAIVSVWARKTFQYSIDFKYLGKILIATLAMSLCVYFLKADSTWGIILAVIAGVAVYGVALFLMRAFSAQDKRLLRQTLRGIIPWLH